MTVIVGIVDKKNNSVILGGDSAGTDGRGKQTKSTQPKVFRSGKFVIGWSGSFRVGNILQHSFCPPKLKKGRDIFEYMVNDFTDEIRETLKKKGSLGRFSDGEDKGEAFLVGHKGRLFSIQIDFSVTESLDGFSTIGSGGLLALGSLNTTDKMAMSAMSKVTYALVSACQSMSSCSTPYNFVTTK